MKTSTLIAASVVAAVAAGSFAPASASVARAVSFNRKVNDADAIVLGKVTATRAQYDPSHRWILTYSTFKVEQTFKGQTGGEVTLATPGGSVDGIRQETVGVPHYKDGDERVVFVKNTKVGPSVLYFDQGNYAVQRDGSDVLVTPAPSELLLVDTQGGKVEQAESQPLALSQFEGNVREALRKPQAVQPGEFGFVNPGGQKQKPFATAVADFLGENKLLMSVLAAGLAVAAWQLLRRSS